MGLCRMSAVAMDLPPPPTPVDLPHDYEVHSNFFIYDSPKMGRRMKFYSELEYQHGLLMESTPEVLQYCEQPYSINLKGRTYVFDCWIRWANGKQELREIKPSGKLVPTEDGRRVPARWVDIEFWCTENSFLSNFVTECDLKPNAARIRNWQRMLPFVLITVNAPDPTLESSVLQFVAASPRSTIGQVCKALARGNHTPVTAIITHLLHRGRLMADLDKHRFAPDLQLTVSLSHANS